LSVVSGVYFWYLRLLSGQWFERLATNKQEEGQEQPKNGMANDRQEAYSPCFGKMI
jgi:hypothetical protein